MKNSAFGDKKSKEKVVTTMLSLGSPNTFGNKDLSLEMIMQIQNQIVKNQKENAEG